MLSAELEFTLNQAYAQAHEKRHEYLTVEHLLLALLDNPSANEVLRGCGVDTVALGREIDEFLNDHDPYRSERFASTKWLG